MFMRKNWQLILALLLAPAMVEVAWSASQYIGQILQKVDLVDTQTNTNPIKTTATLNTSGGAIAVTSTSTVISGQTGGALLTTSTSTVITGQSGGALLVTSTNTVVSGTVNANIQILGSAVDTGKGNVGTFTQRVVVAQDQTTLTVQYSTGPTPAVTKFTATDTSAELLAANLARVGIECAMDCAQTGKVYLNFGAAATANTWIVETCSSWQPPPGIRVTAQVQALADADTKTIRCIEY